jgi:hypothetical protein
MRGVVLSKAMSGPSRFSHLRAAMRHIATPRGRSVTWAVVVAVLPGAQSCSCSGCLSHVQSGVGGSLRNNTAAALNSVCYVSVDRPRERPSTGRPCSLAAFSQSPRCSKGCDS